MLSINTPTFDRVTFSFPKKIVEKLRLQIPKSQMSKYIVALIENDFEKRMAADNDNFINELAEIRKEGASHLKNSDNSLTILRKIRYEE